MISTAIFIEVFFFYNGRQSVNKEPVSFQITIRAFWTIVTFFSTPINTSMDPTISYNEKSSFV